MNLLLLLISSLGLSQGVSTASGYSTAVRFEEPAVVETGDGEFVSFTGVPMDFTPGAPLRSALTFFIPVPPDASPRFSYAASDHRSTGLSGPEAVAPALEGRGLDTREVAAPAAPPPDEYAVLQGVIPLAGSRVAVVTLYPVTGESAADYASEIRFSLQWDETSGAQPVSRNPLLASIAPPGSVYWPESSDQASESIFWGKPWARLAIPETGGYSVTGDQLESAGCAVTGSPCSTLRMYTGPGVMFTSSPQDQHELSEVAIDVVDSDEDGIFDGGDRVRFLARGLSRWYSSGSSLERMEHRYATHNVYWLTWGGEDGQRMQTLQSSPDGSPDWGQKMLSDIWLRQEHIWMPKYQRTTGWIWETLQQGESIDLQFQVGSQGECDITIDVITDESQQHTVSVDINGTVIHQETWYGSGPYGIDIEDALLSGDCDMRISLDTEAGGGILGLSSVHVTYPDNVSSLTSRQLFPSREKLGRYQFTLQDVTSQCRVYDLSDFDLPSVLTGTQYEDDDLTFSYEVANSSRLMIMDSGDWNSPDSIVSAAPGRLMGTIGSGDRLIVVHPSMYSGIQGIESLSIQLGLNPVVATTSEIYNEFGQGVADPGAIRSAVRWGMDSWSGGLSGVVLAGDGHYDFLGYSTSQPVMIPPWIDLNSGQVDCIDDMYVMVHEGAFLPEVPICRIPADNLSELGAFTAKLLGYASGTEDGSWTNRALIIADDEWGQTSQNETSHTVNSELVAEEVLPGRLSRSKFYLIEYPWPPGSWPSGGPHPEKPEARADFIETLGQGFLFTLYQGHGSANQIAHEVMMLGEDVAGLENGSRLPVSMWGTCDVGHFDDPGSDAIGETIVLNPSGGSIASIAATRGTFGNTNYSYFRSIVDSLCMQSDLTIGEAVWQSKLALSTSYIGNNKFYVLFGYSDLPLPMPSYGASVTVEGDTLRSGVLNTLSGMAFRGDGLAFIEVLESSSNMTYTTLGDAQISYVKYGGTAYGGTQVIEDGEFSLQCFVPLQSATGDGARAAAFGLLSRSTLAGARDPVTLIEGDPAGGDLQGPEVDMWIRGYRGIQNPELTGDVTLDAEMSDSSGICILGGGTGKELNLFIDGIGNDVGPYFIYNRGSSVAGKLEYTMQSLSPGDHTLILWSVDGLGNSSRDTLEIRVLEESDLSITEAVVYPNPGFGSRCFSFRVSEDASVTVSIYTVAGRRIEELSAICRQGYNQIIWDGLDHDGDQVATGPYIYEIKADALGSSSVFSRITEVTGIVAVVREE